MTWLLLRQLLVAQLIAGLGLIVVFSALAGAAPSINGIIGFRAGWGVGNALFIATSLAVIVASAAYSSSGSSAAGWLPLWPVGSWSPSTSTSPSSSARP